MHLNLLVLRCKNIENSKTFYEKLGLVFLKEQHGKGAVHYATEFERMVFELYPLKEGYMLENTRLGFTLDCADMHVYLEKVAIAIDSEYVFDGLRVVVVLDPDNRKVELKSLGLNK